MTITVARSLSLSTSRDFGGGDSAEPICGSGEFESLNVSMDSGRDVNVAVQPAGVDKTPLEKTTETKVFDMIENVMSITLQGFFAGSILGLCIENEPRKVANIEHISNGELILI